MNSKVKKILGEVKECIEGADETFINALSSNYRDYAYVVIALNYYMLYEVAYDEEEYREPDIKNYHKILGGLISAHVLSDTEITDAVIESLDALRKQIIDKTNALIKYTAKFYLYEYILNRLEYNFNQPLENSIIKFDDEKFSNRVVDYIFHNDDNMIINEKIRSVVGQLPVRMTKIKFYDLLKESFSIYNGSSSDGFDTYLDRIRTSASLFDIEDGEKIDTLSDELKYFEDFDYLEISKDKFEDLQIRYHKVSKYIEVYTNFYTEYMHIVNMIYVFVLAKKNMTKEEYADTDMIDNLNAIINHIHTCFESDYTMEIDYSMSDKLVCVEGVQEKSHSICMELEQGLADGYLVKYVDSNPSLTEVVKDFNKCLKLTSSSFFMQLEDEDTHIVDKGEIDREVDKLIDEFRNLFKVSQKIYTRAVMANVLSELPVFFTDIAGVSEYVRSQISSCKNEGEKMACYAILSDMMDDEF